MKSLFVSWPKCQEQISTLRFLDQKMLSLACCLDDPNLLHQRCQFGHHHPTRVDSGTEALTKYPKILVLEQVTCHSM